MHETLYEGTSTLYTLNYLVMPVYPRFNKLLAYYVKLTLHCFYSICSRAEILTDNCWLSFNPNFIHTGPTFRISNHVTISFYHSLGKEDNCLFRRFAVFSCRYVSTFKTNLLVPTTGQVNVS
jgi:hypothetical protein